MALSLHYTSVNPKVYLSNYIFDNCRILCILPASFSGSSSSAGIAGWRKSQSSCFCLNFSAEAESMLRANQVTNPSSSLSCRALPLQGASILMWDWSSTPRKIKVPSSVWFMYCSTSLWYSLRSFTSGCRELSIPLPKLTKGLRFEKTMYTVVGWPCFLLSHLESVLLSVLLSRSVKPK